MKSLRTIGPDFNPEKLDSIIGGRVYMLFLLTQMADILINNMTNILPFYGEHFKESTKRSFNNFFRYLKMADQEYDRFVPQAIEGAIDGNWHKLDGNREDANEAIRLLMYWMDRTEKNQALAQNVMDILTNAPEGIRYPEKVIQIFNIRRK